MNWWLLGGGLMGGLVIVLTVSRRLFALPKIRELSFDDRHRCCDSQRFEAAADFGEVTGFDLELGRCANCDAWLMAVFWASSTTYNVISQEQAERFLRLQGTPELHRALETWVN